MSASPSPSVLAALALVLAACGADAPPTDASGVIDASTDASQIDAAIDARPIDAAIDARPIDAMSDAPPPLTINGCTEATSVDRTAAGAARAITFPGFAYTPRCMKIKVGQAVSWSGDFGFHPLRAGQIVNNVPTGQPGNPIPSTDAGPSTTATFAAAGAFGYYCNNHWPGGMTGAIFVVP